jgi:hypothetical protein
MMEGSMVGSALVELRQYKNVAGKRDDLIALFEREFIAEQERLGMEILDQFRDLDDQDRFVWLRGFLDLPTRQRTNEAFYGGEVWAKHREAANATLVDHTNVLMLHPVGVIGGYPVEGERSPVGATAVPDCLVVANVWPLDPETEEEFPAYFDGKVAQVLREAGATILATYATEHSPNNYPRLEIREGEYVFVWLAWFRDAKAYEEFCATLARSERWAGEIAGALAGLMAGEPEVRRLVPTARSRMRG